MASLALLVLVLALLAAPSLVPAPLGQPAARASPPSASLLSQRPAHSVPAAAAPVRPLGSGSSMTYYGNNSTFASVPTSSAVCAVYASSGSSASRTCDAAPQNPSAVFLANGALGVAYSQMTTTTSNGCPNAARNTSVRIGWASSTNGGRSFGAVTDLGNTTCAYEQATEPAFGVSSDGTVIGVYVQYNATNASATLGGKTWTPPWNLGWRKNATMGFVSSATNGTSWSTPTTLSLPGNYVARPSLATFGRSVYVAYDALSPTAQVLTGSAQNPKNSPAVSVELLYSPDEGATWNGPYLLPGLNQSEFNTSMSPSAMVAPDGTVAVAYLSNRSCAPAPCHAAAAGQFSDDIVLATSLTNGSSWSAPHTLARQILEDQCYGDPAQSPWYSVLCYRYLFEFAPAPSLAYDGGTWLVAYAGQNYSTTGSVSQYTGVYVAASGNGGASWSTSVLKRLGSSDEFYSPSVGVGSSGTAYVAFTWENETACPSAPCSPVYNSFSEWMASSANAGASWSDPVLVGLYHPPGGLGAVGGDWTGWRASVVVDPGSQAPAAFFALPKQDTVTTQVNSKGTFTWTNYTWQSNLTVVFPYTGATTTVNFTALGLANGTRWGVLLDGEVFLGNTTALPIAGIPVGAPVLLGVRLPTVGGWTKLIANLGSLSFLPIFYGPTTVPINFTEKFGFQISFHPSLTCAPYYFYLSMSVAGTTYTYSCGSAYSASPAFPWYLPAGKALKLTPIANYYYANSYWNYWRGTGNGSYTGTGLDANITLDAPINESVWATAYGTANVTVTSLGLPATSVVSFTLGGVAYQGSAAGPFSVTNITTGPKAIANVTANSSRPGWEYFGLASCGATLVVPLDQQVNLTFAAVQVAAPAGNVTFAASGIGDGTPWQLQLNGTTYASRTADLVLSLRNGSYPITATPAIASNGSVAYVPVVPTGWANVTVGTTVSLPYRFSYRVQGAAGLGGTVIGPPATWVAPGGFVVYNATASTGYAFAGWTGTGIGSYTGLAPGINLTVGGPIVESAQFYALPTARFNATFTAQGLGPATVWTVFVGGTGYSTNGTTLVVPNLLPCSAGAAGSYNLSIPYTYNGSNGTRFLPSAYPSKFCVNGAYVRSVVFSAEFLLTVQATVGGLALAGAAGGVTNQSVWVPFSEAPTITATAFGNNSFLYWNGTGSGSYSGAQSFVQLTLGGPVQELAVFVPPLPKIPPRFTLTLLATGLPAGTVWGATVGGTGYVSSTSQLNVTGLTNGTYTLAVPSSMGPDGLARYDAAAVPPTVEVRGKTTFSVAFQTSYWVEVRASGGGSVSPSGGAWYLRGKVLALVATPDPLHIFLGWSGNGSGPGVLNYSGPNATPAGFRVLGPIVEYAAFGAPPPAVSVAASPYASPAVWAGFAVVGAAVGILLGYRLLRPRSPVEGAAPEGEPEGPSDSSPSEAMPEPADGSPMDAEWREAP